MGGREKGWAILPYCKNDREIKLIREDGTAGQYACYHGLEPTAEVFWSRTAIRFTIPTSEAPLVQEGPLAGLALLSKVQQATVLAANFGCISKQG